MATDIIARALAIQANKTLPAISSADAGKLATVDSNGKWAAAELDVGQGEVAVDSTLLVTGAAADAKVTGDKVAELKSAVGDVETAMGMEYTPASGTKTANYYLYAQGGKLYKQYSATSHYYTVDITAGRKYQLAGTASDYKVYFGTGIGETIPDGGNIGNISDTEPHLYTAPTGATKLFYSSNVDVTVTAFDASNKTYELADAVQKNAEDIAEIKVKSKKTYMIDRPSKVLMPEFASHFWCPNSIPNTFTGEAVVMTVSGTAGNNYLSVSSIEPNTITLTDVNRSTGFVMTEDGVHYTVYEAIYNAENEKLEIYPKLVKNISDAIFASVFLDSGYSYTGMHLTEHGFKAYVEWMYSQNPKHCEIGLYNEAFDSRTLSASSQYPFQKISTDLLYLGMAATVLDGSYLKNYFPMRFEATFAAAYTPYTAKNGVYWDVNLNGTSGYLELIMNAKAPTLDALPEGQEVYVDVYFDGELKSQTIITDPICKRICIDYENATSGRLEIYCNKWAAISGSSSGFEISKAVWWINEMKYPENAKLFPKGVFVAQEFDSWGVYNDGVTGKRLQEFISTDAGVTVPLENHSLGSQTTAWGLAYWYQNVLAYHPAIAITDFGINDSNSVSSSTIPETITGPDGKVYNNKITQEMFVENTGKLIDFAISNGIQPIVMRNFQHAYYNFIDAAIEGLSSKHEA